MIKGEELGLLLYKGGTVCDRRYFNDNAAGAICKQMNYARSVEYDSRPIFDSQVRVNLSLVVFRQFWFVYLRPAYAIVPRLQVQIASSQYFWLNFLLFRNAC